MKKILYKIRCKLIDLNNKKVDAQIDNYYFLKDLCSSNGVLDLDKYSRLLKMIKRKYK
jgi:uncharacterized protein YerC